MGDSTRDAEHSDLGIGISGNQANDVASTPARIACFQMFIEGMYEGDCLLDFQS